MDLENILERIKPYDMCNSFQKETFVEYFKIFPQLKEALQKQILLPQNSEWVTKVNNTNDIYFILIDSRWKRRTPIRINPSISILLVGPNEYPVIEICL